MSASDRFREYLKAGNFAEALNLALTQAVELEITTWVPFAGSATPDEPERDRALTTRINIVEGEIENRIGTQFIGNSPYRELREFHATQAENGQQMIQQNLASLQQVFTILTAALPPAPLAATTPPALSPATSPQQSLEHREKTY